MLAIKDVPFTRSDSILAQLRISTGLTQKKLAIELGMLKSKTSLSSAESGGYTKPGLRAKLSTYYKIPEEGLFDEYGFAHTIEEEVNE